VAHQVREGRSAASAGFKAILLNVMAGKCDLENQADAPDAKSRSTAVEKDRRNFRPDWMCG